MERTEAEHEAKVCAYLVATYAPAVILLGGSRAVGAARPDSDWDLFLITASGATRERVADGHAGAHLDLELVPAPFVADGVLCIAYGPVHALRVLRDDADGHGRAIVAATRKVYAAGPPPLAAPERRRHAANLARLLSKVDAYVDEPVASAAHAGIFLQHLLPCWSALRGEWPQPPQRAVPHIRERDPAFIALLSAMVAGDTAATRAAACRRAYTYLFPGEARA